MSVEETKAKLTEAMDAIKVIRDGLCDSPLPKPETAFQEMVRAFADEAHTQDLSGADWDELKARIPHTLPALRAFYNATLELAKTTVFAEYGQDPDGSIACDMIQALKEPMP